MSAEAMAAATEAGSNCAEKVNGPPKTFIFSRSFASGQIKTAPLAPKVLLKVPIIITFAGICFSTLNTYPVPFLPFQLIP